ncbi:MAG: AAA family ATPase, partial [Deltaproteobacteria bacterium]
MEDGWPEQAFELHRRAGEVLAGSGNKVGVMDMLMIPKRLYGRDSEIASLLRLFEWIGRGHGGVLLVPGYSGVGKTTLVKWLRIPVQERDGFFIQGKFDQYQQSIPYSGVRDALSDLCGQLQSGNEEQRRRSQVDILDAVGNLGQLLLELVPEFETLLGQQHSLADITPQEARHRFAGLFQNFLKAVCRPEHPVVLFIDDWQWADAASFELLRRLEIGTLLRYLLVIVSYRDNEVDPSHPLFSMVEDLRGVGVPVEVLPVRNLKVNDVRLFLSDTLKPAAANIEGLATVIYGRTGGNPFFVRSILTLLLGMNMIGFNFSRNMWDWQLESISGAELPGNLVELFLHKLRSLDRESRNLFSLAACLGNRFDLETLGIVSGRTEVECHTLLFSDQAKGLLLPPGVSGADPEDSGICRFLHDSVQQAAYTLIEPAELPSLLLRIGRLMVARLQPEQPAERLFEVVRNLNAGAALVEDVFEQIKILELNVTAARKAYI